MSDSKDVAPAKADTEGTSSNYVPKRELAKRTGAGAKVKPHVDESEYQALYKESIEQPDKFWDKVSYSFNSRISKLKCIMS